MGGEIAGRKFWNQLRICMNHLGFESCLADPDVWMRASTRTYGTKYYEYVLMYVDDWLVISDKAKDILKQYIGKYFEPKEDPVGPPSLYHGGQMRKFVLEDGFKEWVFGYAQYVKTYVRNVEE